MTALDRIAAGWRSLIYGNLNANSNGLSRRDAAGGLVYGGPRTRATWPDYALDGQVKRAYALAVVQACIDAIARDVSAAPLRVYREVDGQPEAQAGHAARVVIADPNPAMSEAEFWYFATAMMATTGYCVIEKVRSGAGRPVELWPLVSPWLKVLPKPQALPDWEYRVPGNDPWPLPAEDAIVLTYRPDPWGGWTGRTPLTALKRELAIDDQLTDFLNVLLERGGVPPLGLKVMPQEIGGKMVVPTLSESERDYIVESFAQKYGGVNNWAKPAFLGGLSVERIGLDLNEMLYTDVRDMIELHMCSAMGVPAGMIGTRAGLERNTYSNAETDVRKYYDGTIAPLWARLDGAFTRGLLREFDGAPALSMGFDVSRIGALQEDEAPKWDQAIRAVGSGFLTVDDARARVGLEPLPDGSGGVLLLPFSAIVVKPADLAIMAGETAKPPEPVPAPLADANPAPQSGDEPDTDPGALSDDERALRVRRLPQERRAMIATRSKQTIARLARKGAPPLRAFWKAQGARIVTAATRAAIHGGDGRLMNPSEVRDLSEIDWPEEERLLGEVLARFYGLTGETAFAEVSGQVGVTVAWDLANPNVRRLMGELALRVTGINQTTREDVQRIVADALTEGVSGPQLAERLTGLFEETYKGRSLTVARSESQVAYGMASVTGYTESGVVAYVELMDNPDHTEDYGASDGLSCAQRDGLIVPLEQARAHILAEHPNGSLATAPVLATALGEV